jgi:hypothetical protein
MKNTISLPALNVNFVATDLPFGNNFVQKSAKIVQYQGTDEILAYVLCTKDSMEPGRIYACNYSMAGRLEACNTIN